MMSMLHIAGGKLHPQIWNDCFLREVCVLADLALVEDGNAMPEEERAALIRQHPVLLTCWESPVVPAVLADDPGALRYICHITGTLRGLVPLEVIDRGIQVTNWGDAPAFAIAEGTMALLLAALKDLRAQAAQMEQGGWTLDGAATGGSLDGLHVGLYGLGIIGRRVVAMLRPFNPVLHVFDPYVDDLPDDCRRVESLEALFDVSQAVLILAGLSDETRGSVTADLLARLPDHGVIVNTARGAIIDQDALFAELERGRLRAGLDVLEPDILPEDHPARHWKNCLLTGHGVHRGWPDDPASPRLQRLHRNCLDNLRRFLTGEPLQFLMDRTRYLRST
jgi:phosphoglycerate dehydrogenase-like enzyme